MLNRPEQAITQFAYNTFGDVTELVDTYGVTHTFSFDANGNALGSSWNWVNPLDAEDVRPVVATNVYDANDRLIQTIGPQGSTSTEYDLLGQVVKTIDRFGQETLSTHDARGQLIETEYPDGTIARTVYDAKGRAEYVVDQHLPGQPASGTRTLYDEADRVIGTQRLANLVIDIDLDVNDQPFSFVDSHDPTPLSTTSTEYDDVGRVEETTSVTGLVTRYEYDTAGRLVATIDDDGSTEFRRESDYDVSGRQIATRDALERETRYVYDDASRLLKTILPDGTFTESVYDSAGRRIGAIDQLGRSMLFVYDRHGNLLSVALPPVQDPDDDPGQSVRPTYAYEYDDFGNQILIVDPLGRETHFAYDQFGQQVSRTLPEIDSQPLFVESRTYTSLGQLETLTSFEGEVTEYSYDDLGRVETIDYYAPGDFGVDPPTDTVEYEYDLYDIEGRHDQVTDSRGVTETRYDTEGRIVRVESPEGILRYEYDPATSQQTRAYTDDTGTRYAYDLFGRLEEATVHERLGQAITPETMSYTYDAVGNLKTATLPNGILSEYTYDDLNQLLLLTHNRTSDSEVLASYTYERYADGRLKTAVEEDEDGTTRYDWVYDDLGRLIEERYEDPLNANDYTTRYAHDLVGNRLTKETDRGSDEVVDEVITYLYDDLDRLLVELLDEDNDTVTDRTTVYEYGPNADPGVYGGDGTQQTRKAVWDEDDIDPQTGTKLSQTEFEYNLQGRLATAIVDSDGDETPESTSLYTYDDQGIRVSQTINGTSIEYVIDYQNHTGYAHVLEERDATSGDVIKSYTFGHSIIAQTDDNGDTLYFLLDGGNSTRQVTDDDAEVIESYDHDAFGNAIDFDPAAAATNHLYRGEQFDHATGQHYLRARYYDASIGRFNRLDPYAGNSNNPRTFHEYVYAHGDPIGMRDPTGLFGIGSIAVSAFISVQIRTQDITARVFPALAAATFQTQLLAHQILTALPAVSYRLTQVSLALSFFEGATHAWLNNSNSFPDGTIGERFARGRALEATSGANLGGTVQAIDDLRDGHATSVRTHSLATPHALLSAIGKDLKDIEGIENRRLQGVTSSGVSVTFLPGEVRSKGLLVGIPSNQSHFLTVAFRQQVESLARSANAIVRIVPVTNWRR